MQRKLAYRPERDHNLKLQHNVWKNKAETVSTQPGEKANELKNSSTRSKKHGASVPMEVGR